MNWPRGGVCIGRGGVQRPLPEIAEVASDPPRCVPRDDAFDGARRSRALPTPPPLIWHPVVGPADQPHPLWGWVESQPELAVPWVGPPAVGDHRAGVTSRRSGRWGRFGAAVVPATECPQPVGTTRASGPGK
jgi:hypothetical protein